VTAVARIDPEQASQIGGRTLEVFRAIVEDVIRLPIGLGLYTAAQRPG